MDRKIFFDKPTTVDVESLPIGAIFFVDDEPYMKITEAIDNFQGERVNSVHLYNGELELWENKHKEDFVIEYFPNYQNIKIVGD